MVVPLPQYKEMDCCFLPTVQKAREQMGEKSIGSSTWLSSELFVVVVVVVVVVAVAAVVVAAAVVVVVVVVLTLTRIIKSVVTEQAPATLGSKITPGKTQSKPKASHASTKKCKQMRSEVSLRTRQVRSTGTCVSRVASETSRA